MFRLSATGSRMQLSLAALALGAALLLECAGLALWRKGFWAVPHLILLHVFLIAALLWMHLRLGRSSDAFLALVLSMFLGPFGFLGGALLLVTRVVTGDSGDETRSWLAALARGESSGSHRVAVYQRIAAREGLGRRQRATPFRNILLGGAMRLKQTAVAKMARNFDPRFAPLLEEAVNDRDNSVRIQAASAITKLADDFMEHGWELEAALDESPHDETKLLELVHHYAGYAGSGLLDPLSEPEIQAKALKYCHEYLALQPGDCGVKLMLARILLRQGAVDDVLELLASGWAPARRSGEWLLLKAEALYLGARYTELRAMARQWLENAEWRQALPEAEAGILSMWGRWPRPRTGEEAVV